MAKRLSIERNNVLAGIYRGSKPLFKFSSLSKQREFKLKKLSIEAFQSTADEKRRTYGAQRWGTIDFEDDVIPMETLDDTVSADVRRHEMRRASRDQLQRRLRSHDDAYPPRGSLRSSIRRRQSILIRRASTKPKTTFLTPRRDDTNRTR